MITLMQYAPGWGVMNASPFCMKVEAFLRLVNLPYEAVTLPDPRKSPKGKLPFIEDNGRRVSDSSLILDYLIEQYALKIDESLTDNQRSQSLALQRLLEEHLYWVIVYSRWIEEAGWQQVKSSYFSSLPALLKAVVPAMLKRTVKQALYAQGLGRHSRDEIYHFGIKDLEVIRIQLEQHPFLLDTVSASSIDAIGYSFMANILQVPIESPLKDYMRQHECFEKYCDVMAPLCQPA